AERYRRVKLKIASQTLRDTDWMVPQLAAMQKKIHGESGSQQRCGSTQMERRKEKSSYDWRDLLSVRSESRSLAD
ncbi:MAG: hypothetical protein ACLPND_25910, partial [Candidatus Korobacteraceae bacterium]